MYISCVGYNIKLCMCVERNERAREEFVSNLSVAYQSETLRHNTSYIASLHACMRALQKIKGYFNPTWFTSVTHVLHAPSSPSGHKKVASM